MNFDVFSTRQVCWFFPGDPPSCRTGARNKNQNAERSHLMLNSIGFSLVLTVILSFGSVQITKGDAAIPQNTTNSLIPTVTAVSGTLALGKTIVVTIDHLGQWIKAGNDARQLVP